MDAKRWERIDHLFQSALHLSVSQRPAFLAAACAGDSGLRREIESLLASGDRAGNFLDSPPSDVAAALLADKKTRPVVGGKIGAYEIVSLIGKGGMGEVFRATDTRLNRTVAIKVLPAHLSNNPDLRRRFELEARAISNLNHPHICTLYDIGEQDGMDFIVMEYLDGETLADRLTRGPLSMVQALRCAHEIADALNCAHTLNVIHRDLKPGNIMLTRTGAKLLDFGLAKLITSAEPRETTSESSGQKTTLTVPGMILGTPQYMAPEQLEGKDADERTDIFALGSVIYEMATGRKAFEGEGQASLISAIMSTDPPPISSLRQMTPPTLDRLVQTCLAKNADDRWHSARDLMFELEWIDERAAERLAADRGKGAGRGGFHWFAWATAAALVVLAVVWISIYLLRVPLELAPIRSFILPPEDSTIYNTAISPNGNTLAFVAWTAERKPYVWIRPVDSLSARQLLGTEGASTPFWSPDSRSIVFFAEGKLKRIDLTGSPALTLCDSKPLGGGTWNSDGVILFGDTSGPIHRVSESGGKEILITDLDNARNAKSHRFPFFLPDGRHFFYVATTGSNDSSAVYVASIDSKEKQLLLYADSDAVYAQGFLLFVRQRSLMAQSFDTQRMKTLGEPVTVSEQEVFPIGKSFARFSASQTGVLAYLPGPSIFSRLLWHDRGGKRIGSFRQQADYYRPRISPDGDRVAVDIRRPGKPNNEIWLFDLARDIGTLFTSDSWAHTHPVWSPDGSRIAYASSRKAARDLYEKPSNGTAGEETLLQLNGDKTTSDWSSDGRFLAYNYRDPGRGKWGLWILPHFGERKPFAFLPTEFDQRDGQFSPDDRWIAYSSDEAGKPDVYIAPFPGPGGRTRVSTNGGAQPRWRRDGTELFFLASDNNLMVSEVNVKGAILKVTVPRSLFETQPKSVGIGEVYDVSANGQRFLINTRLDEKSMPITLVVNWMTGLKRH